MDDKENKKFLDLADIKSKLENNRLSPHFLLEILRLLT